MTAPDMALLPVQKRTVAGKLAAVKAIGGAYDIVFLHRDADRDGRAARVAEIAAAVAEVMPDSAHVPVVPIRMTEAWLLLDEQQIREVAGNPNGKVGLNLPSSRNVERIADPKAHLQEALVTAAELTGRRRKSFQNAFPYNRRLLLERLDPDGPVSAVPSWRQFVADTTTVFAPFMPS